MGNISLTTPAVVVCKIDSDLQNITAGSVVIGKVYLDVRKDRLECDTLQLQISGSERTCVRYTTHSGTG